jgi:hypothetical protein
LYRSLAKRDTAYNYAVIIGVLGAIVLDNLQFVEVIFRKYLPGCASFKSMAYIMKGES